MRNTCSLLFFLALCIGLSACTSAIETSDGKISSETSTSIDLQITSMMQSDSLLDHIQLGMQPADLLSFFKEKEIEIESPNYEDYPWTNVPFFENGVWIDIPMIQDRRRYNYDGSFYYKTKSIEAIFSTAMTLTDLFVKTDQFETDLGVKIGDSKEKMIQLYGENYIPDDLGYDEIRYYNYKYGDFYIHFRMNQHTIDGWGITRELT